MAKHSEAAIELKALWTSWTVWIRLAMQDIGLKYRRSSIGPLWLTLSTAITIYTMGFLYSHLFKLDLKTYFPYLSSGIIGWSFISIMMIESTSIFTEAEQYIRNQESFFSIFTMRFLLRNLIIFLHNLLAFIPVACFFTGIGWHTLLLIPGLALVGIIAFFWGSLFAIIGTRYRDFTQVTASFAQVIFFLSPVMWMPTLLPNNFQWIVIVNPFYYLLNVIRKPMMNELTSLYDYGVLVILAIIGWVFYSAFISKYRHRIVFWL